MQHNPGVNLSGYIEKNVADICLAGSFAQKHERVKSAKEVNETVIVNFANVYYSRYNHGKIHA